MDLENSEIDGTEIEGDQVDQSLLLTKDQLPNSACCRFCGLGGKNEFGNNPTSDLQFIPIYQKPFEDSLETLDNIINRYLPIKVYENDPYYPKVICAPCYESFERTMYFFDKITEGQELLSKIINQLNEVKKAVAVIEEKNSKKLDFSYDNPILNAKRRRGRPRKDPNEPKNLKKPNVSVEYLERSKRNTRPPARYVAAEVPSEVKEEVLPSDIENDKRDEFLVFLDTSIANPDPKYDLRDRQPTEAKETDSNLVTTMDNDFPNLGGLTRRENLLELSVIMDGDEEIDPTVLQLVEIDNSILNKGNKSTIPINTPMPENETPLETDNLDTNSNDNEVQIISIQERSGDENEGSDTSVQLADLVRNSRKPIRKKQIRRSRKSKTYRRKQHINCLDCDKSFSHQSSLLYHRAAAHDLVKKYVCSTCKKGFSHKQLLTNHLYTHMEEKCFACDLCPSKFKSRASLYTHKKSIHVSKKEFTCEKCGLQFNLKSSLKTHMRLHTGEKPFACEFCQKRFAQASNMREHRRTHTGERPYVCPTADCDKSFTTASQLRNHKVTHTGLKPYLCSVCGKAFANNENFKYHMRRHTGDRPLECPVCQKQFIEPWSLKKHWRLHSGEKPYQCRQCNKDFSDPSNYSKHKRMHLENSIINGTEQPDELQIEIQAVYDNADIPTSGETVVEDQDNIVTDLSEHISSGQLVTENSDLGDDNHTQSLEQILNGGDFTTIEGRSPDGQSSVIYVYPGEVPVYTITIADNEQTIEVRADDEAALQQALGTLAGGPITFTTVDPGDINSDYFDLETVDGTTTAMVTASQLSNLSRTAIVSNSREDVENLDAD